MGKGARYNVGGTLSIYNTAADAIARSSPRSTITNTYSSVEGEGTPYRDEFSGWDSYYPAIPIWWMPYWGGSGYNIGWVNDYDNYQASKPTVSPKSVDLGTQVTITYPRNNAAIRHTVKLKVGSKTVTILTKSNTTSTTYTPTMNDFASQLPNVTSLAGDVIVESYDGDRLIGTETTKLTVRIPTSVKPVIGTITVSDLNTIAAGLEAGFIQGISTLRGVAASIAAGQGATVKTRSWSFDGQTGTSTGLTGPTFKASNKTSGLTISLTVTDSRGRSTTKSSSTFGQVAYSRPTISKFDAKRYDENDQDKVNFNLTATRTSLGDKNTLRYRIRKQKVGQSTTTTHKAWTSPVASDLNLSATIMPDLVNDGDYLLTVEVEDKFTTTSRSFALMGSSFLWQRVTSGRKVEYFLPNGMFLNDSELKGLTPKLASTIRNKFRVVQDSVNARVSGNIVVLTFEYNPSLNSAGFAKYDTNLITVNTYKPISWAAGTAYPDSSSDLGKKIIPFVSSGGYVGVVNDLSNNTDSGNWNCTIVYMTEGE